MLEVKKSTSQVINKSQSSFDFLFKVGDYQGVLKKIGIINNDHDFFLYLGALFGSGDLNTASNLLNNAINYLSDLNEYVSLYVYYFKARINFYQGEYEKGFQICSFILDSLKSYKNFTLETVNESISSSEIFEGLLFKLIGENKVSHNDISEGIYYLELSKAIYKKNSINIGAIAWINHQLGRAYFLQGEIEVALKATSKALEIRKKIGNSHHIALSLNLLGAIYEKIGKIDEALQYFEQGLVYSQKISGNPSIISMLQSNIGLILIKKGDLVNAKKFLLCALEIGKKLDGHKIFISQLKDEILKNISFIEKTIVEINKKLDKNNSKFVNSNIINIDNPREIEKLQQFNKILGILKETDTDIYQKDLPALTNLSKSTISRRVNELIEEGVVKTRLLGKTRAIYLK